MMQHNMIYIRRSGSRTQDQNPLKSLYVYDRTKSCEQSTGKKTNQRIFMKVISLFNLRFITFQAGSANKMVQGAFVISKWRRLKV